MNKLQYTNLFLFVFTACYAAKGQDVFDKSLENKKLSIVAKVIHELDLDRSKDQIDFAIAQVSPNNPEETIVVIPEVVNEEDDKYELNSNIVIVDNRTGKIVHKYFESSKTNGWVSDAIFISEIVIDTMTYRLTPSKSAFGITSKWRSSSQPNPYNHENISLYIKEENSLKKVLDSYTIYESSGEVNVNACSAKFNKTVSKLSVSASDSTTSNYFDILVEKTTSEEVFQEDENGECNPKEKIISTEGEMLKFDNEVYKKKESLTENLKILQAVIDSVSINEIKRYCDISYSTIYDYYMHEKIDEVAIWSDKMFGRCCSEADLDYSELLKFEITATTGNAKYPPDNLSDNYYRTAYVFKENQNAEIQLKLIGFEEHKYHTNLLVDEVLRPNDTLLGPFKLSLVNGYVKSQKTFKENGRVKELKVLLNNTLQGTVELQDTPLVQQFEMDFTFFKNDEVTLIPISFYKGTTYDDICISEIQSSLSQITHPSIDKKYRITELRRSGNSIKKPEE